MCNVVEFERWSRKRFFSFDAFIGFAASGSFARQSGFRFAYTIRKLLGSTVGIKHWATLFGLLATLPLPFLGTQAARRGKTDSSSWVLGGNLPRPTASSPIRSSISKKHLPLLRLAGCKTCCLSLCGGTTNNYAGYYHAACPEAC